MAGITKQSTGCSHDPVPEHIEHARAGKSVRLNICSPHGHQISQAMSYVDAVRIARELEILGIGALLETDLRSSRRAFHEAIEQGNVTSLVIGCRKCGEVRFVLIVMPMPARPLAIAKTSAGEVANSALSTAETVSTAETPPVGKLERRRQLRTARQTCVNLLCQLTTTQLVLLLCELAVARACSAVKWLFSSIDG